MRKWVTKVTSNTIQLNGTFNQIISIFTLIITCLDTPNKRQKLSDEIKQCDPTIRGLKVNCLNTKT